MPAVKLSSALGGGGSSSNAGGSSGGGMSSLAGGAASVLGSVVGGVTGAAGGVLSSASTAANSSDGMRGLAVFISDIRNCKSREAEIKRINKELANIRSKFKGDKTLDGYQKKKYVCKLLFIFLLGHDIDFGYMEAVNLLSSNKYTEKQIGYLFISVLISPNNDLMKLVIQSLKNDLTSKNPVFVCLALNCISNLGSSKEMAEAFGRDIPKFLTSGDCTDSIKQSASLCLLNMLRSHPETLAPHVSEWGSRVIHLLNDQHLGVVTSACGLVNELVSKNPFEYKTCANLAVSRLSRIVTSSYTDLQDYTYYFVPAPWLCILLLRLLQNWPLQTPRFYDPATRAKLLECLDTLLNKSQEPPKSKKVQHSNARNAVLFEAIDLIAHCWSTSDGILSANEEETKGSFPTESSLMTRGVEILARFLSHRETNLRFLALESLGSFLAAARVGNLETEELIIGASVARHKDLIVNALRNERDPSVRRGAADLLYAACGATPETDCEFVCAQLADYLTGEGCVAPADYTAREETVLKMAALAERYAKDRRWYLDTILNLIRMAGDHVSDEVWFRAVQIVVNHEDVQGYAAKAVFEAIVRPPITSKAANAPIASATGNATTVVDYFYCHENLIKVAGYILGEFGNLIAGDPRSSPILQFQALHSKFHLCSNATKAMLLSTYVKFVNLFPEIKGDILNVLNSDYNIRSSDPEIQQRAVEYVKLSESVSPDVLAVVLEEMPPFSESSSSATLLTRLIKDKKNKKTNLDGTLSNRSRHNSETTSGGTGTPKKPFGVARMKKVQENGGELVVDDLLEVNSPHQLVNTNNDQNFHLLNNAGDTGFDGKGSKDEDILAQIFTDVSIAPTTQLPREATINRRIDFDNINSNNAGPSQGASFLSTVNEVPKNMVGLGGYSSTNVQEINVEPNQIWATFLLKNAGVIYEDPTFQLGAKINPSESQPQGGGGECTITLYYGNKPQSEPIINLKSVVSFDIPAQAGSKSASGFKLVSVQPPQMPALLDPGVQVVQKFVIKNLSPPLTDNENGNVNYSLPQLKLEYTTTTPSHHISQADPFAINDPFSTSFQPTASSNSGGTGKFQPSTTFRVNTHLPLTLNKFCDIATQQTKMDQTGFFQRWRALVNPGQEYQKVFKALNTIDATKNNEKVRQFGLTILDGIDSNSDNTVASGIILTESQPVGCLLRLEPNKKTSMYRLTIRSTRPAVSKELGLLLTDTNLF